MGFPVAFMVVMCTAIYFIVQFFIITGKKNYRVSRNNHLGCRAAY